MFTKFRIATAVSAVLLSVCAVPASAAEQAARVDTASCEKPAYPSRWVSSGEEGDVVVAYLVDTDGRVTASKVVESSGSARVDRASVKAGAQCKFQPAARDGQGLAGWAKVRYSWVIQ